MIQSICGVDCSQCEYRGSCNGCAATSGKPFHGQCVLASCCKNQGLDVCETCESVPCKLKKELLEAFHGLGIPDLEEVTELYALKGALINLEYTLPNGRTFRFWDDTRIYLGNQVHKKGSDRCYGLAADEHYLLVCECGENGSNPQVMVYKSWKL